MTLQARIDESIALPSPANEPRILMSELCGIAKISRITIMRRVGAGTFPGPIDRGREYIFDRQAAYLALGIRSEDGNHEAQENPWERGANAISELRSAALCGPTKAR